MNRLRWQLGQALRAGGLPAWAALGVLVATALAWWLSVRPALMQVESLRQQNVELLRKSAQPRGPGPATTSLEAELAAFENRFESERGIGTALGRLHAAAQRHGVEFEAGVFRLEAPSDRVLARYVMDWPVQADYRALRRFLADALREQPALALEAVSLQRDDPAQPRVTARLRWVLFVSRPA